MTEEPMVKWLREVWDRRLYALLKKRGMLALVALKINEERKWKP